MLLSIWFVEKEEGLEDGEALLGCEFVEEDGMMILLMLLLIWIWLCGSGTNENIDYGIGHGYEVFLVRIQNGWWQ